MAALWICQWSIQASHLHDHDPLHVPLIGGVLEAVSRAVVPNHIWVVQLSKIIESAFPY